MIKTKNHTPPRALALVTVLWVVMILSAMVAVIAKTSRLDTRITIAGTEQVAGKWACRAALETALALLNEDPRTSDGIVDLWTLNPQFCELVELPGCIFNIEFIDEAGKLNLNTAAKEQLLWLPNMTEVIADAIIDWRDTDDNPQPYGVEGDYYLNMPFPYLIRNDSFRTIRELLLVEGVTPELFYGEDTNSNGRLDYNENDGDLRPPLDNGDNILDLGWISYLTCYSYDDNTDGQGQPKVNINTANEQTMTDSLEISSDIAQWIVQNREYTSIAGLLSNNSPLDIDTFISIADRITVSEEQQIPGLINLNSASEYVLMCLLNGDENLAENIIAYRQSLPEGMHSIGELLNVQGVTLDVFQNIENSITNHSNVFTVSCSSAATRTGALFFAEAVVDRSQKPVQVLYWHQGANH